MVQAFQFLPTVNVRKQIADLQALSKSIGEVNNKTLSLVGRDVYEAAKRGVGQSAPAKKGSGRPEYVEIAGGLYRDTSSDSGKPRPAGKPVKSWAPGRFIYRDIAYFLDARTGTVVVGPYKLPWLNQLHEFGGTVTQTAWLVGEKAARVGLKARSRGRRFVGKDGRPVSGTVAWRSVSGATSPGFEQSATTRTARYPARPFIQGAAGVQKALAKASLWFKDTYYPKPLR